MSVPSASSAAITSRSASVSLIRPSTSSTSQMRANATRLSFDESATAVERAAR